MGILDDLKGKAQKVIGGNQQAIKDGIEKAGDFVDSKTGGKHADKIDSVQRGASDFVDKQNGTPGTAPAAGEPPVAGQPPVNVEPPVAGEPRQQGL
ncbi:antitoxin [Pseudarthrobacter sp. O4]|uniref:antitoxin n=1 Tax=Pseudarthrobacter sp. O4 TaxID=3418417 RepID=UPI003CFA4B03